MSNQSWWANKMKSDKSAAPPSSTPPVRAPAPARIPPLPRPTPQSSPGIQVTAENFAEASMQWSGGEAARTDFGNCPSCASNLFFSRANSGSAVAPRCYSCGYTQGRPQQGMPT